MVWFQKRRPAEYLDVPSIEFIGEQDGPPEMLLKDRLVPVLAEREHIQTAFLARAIYESDHEIHVVLCLLTDDPSDAGTIDPQLSKAVGNVFANIFGSHEHLDTLMISGEQETELRSVCRPFYVKNQPQPSN